MNRHLDEYLLFLSDTKQVSANTYASYKRDLMKFVQYLEEKHIADFDMVDTDVIQEYIAYLNQCNYASTTVTRSFIAIKSFFRYLCSKGYMTENPNEAIKLPKAVSKPNTVLSKEEMQLLLNPPVEFSFKGLRDRAMLLLLYDTKISISDLVCLKVSAVDFQRKVLVLWKEDMVREYQLSDELTEALEVYVNYKKLRSDDWLFPNRYGNPMSRQGFWKTIKNYSRDLGIDKDITLYSIKQGEV